MTTPADFSAPVEVQRLLEHTDWLRRLALQLVDDPSRADDVVQQSYLEALRRPPGHGGSPRGWLAKVARNVAAATGRSDRRRRDREALAARPEASGETDPAVSAERVAMQRELMDEVLELRQPYRDVIVLRFFEGLPQRQIAKRLGRPVATIDTQLQRGLGLLRERFDRSHGTRRAWVTALAPIVRVGGAPVASASAGAKVLGSGSLWTAGGLLMTWKLAAPTAAAGVSLALLFWLFGGEPGAVDSPSAPEGGDVVRSATAAPGAPASTVAASRAAVAEPSVESPPAKPTPETVAILGRVYGIDGISPAGVGLEWRDPKQPRWTQQGAVRWLAGSAALSWQPFQGRIGAARDALRREFAGPGGLEALRKSLPAELQAAAVRLRDVLRGDPVGPRVTSDATGRFAIDARFQPSSRDVFALAPDRMVYGAGQVPEGRADAGAFAVMVGPAARVFGRVVDHRDRPVPGASVELVVHPDSSADVPSGTLRFSRMWSARTDEDGWFDLGRVPSAKRLRIGVSKDGYEYDESLAPGMLGAQPALVRLKSKEGAQPTTITGRVVDVGNHPVAEATVALGSKQVASDSQGRFELPVASWKDASALLAFAPGKQAARIDAFGAKLRADLAVGKGIVLRLGPETLSIRGRVLSHDGEPLSGWKVVLMDGTPRHPWGWVEDALAGGDKNTWGGSQTGADGRFELRGLNARGYRLRAFNPQSLVTIDSPVVPAGTDSVELRRPQGCIHERLDGVVVDGRGQPVHGVAVRLHLSNGRSPIYIRDLGVTTDASGAFSLEAVPRTAVELRFSGHDKLAIEPTGLALDGSQVSPLRVVVARQLRVRLVPGSTSAGCTASFLDGDGRELEAVILSHARASRTTQVRLDDSIGVSVALPATARTLVVKRGDAEASRQPLPTTPGTTHEVRLP